MRENIGLAPPRKVERRARRQEIETGLRQFGAVRENAVTLRDEFDIRSAGVEQSAGSLSGRA